MDLGLGFSTAHLFRPTIRRIRDRTVLQIFTPGIIDRIAEDRRFLLVCSAPLGTKDSAARDYFAVFTAAHRLCILDKLGVNNVTQ
jgi:hypothetical protein